MQKMFRESGHFAARHELDVVAESGPALARLAAQIGRSFVDAPPAELHGFLERLFGGWPG